MPASAARAAGGDAAASRAAASAPPSAGSSGAPPPSAAESAHGTAGAAGARAGGAEATSAAAAGRGASAAAAAAAAGSEQASAASAGSSAGASAAGSDAAAAPFALMPVGFPMAGDELTFPDSANPPQNVSPEFTWTGVPPGSASLALAFRDLGNGAVKWVIWDIPPTVDHLPPDISPVAMPSEVPGSSQLGSLNHQGYAGPGSGARLYDFTLWALDVERLPVTGRESTVEIHDNLLAMHELAKTEPVLVRNTRNLP